MSSPLPSRLVKIRTKIERAEKHIHEFQTEFDAFGKTDPYSIGTEDDPQTGDKVFRVKSVAPIPLVLPIIIGDVLHNLRSALDHLVWHLVEAAGSKPTTQTSFPIFKTATDCRKFFKKLKTGCQPKIEGISRTAMKLIKRTKPYKRGNKELWLIHELNNIDKHRLLIPTMAISPYLALEREGKFASVWQRPNIKLVKKGAELFRWPNAIAEKMDMKTKLAVVIAFGEPKIIKGQPVLELLHQLMHLVDGVVNQFISLL